MPENLVPPIGKTRFPIRPFTRIPQYRTQNVKSVADNESSVFTCLKLWYDKQNAAIQFAGMLYGMEKSGEEWDI